MRFLSRPDVRGRRLQALTRRVRYEGERRLAPRLLERERRVRVDGMTMLVRPRDAVERAIYLYGAHEHRALQAFRELVTPSSVVVDAGAHVGQYTLVAAARGARVLAFEPAPATYERLARHVRLNGLTNVTALRVALGPSPGRAHLAVASMDNSGEAAVVDAPTESSVEVEVARLDDVLAQHGVERVDLMKLDVEGREVGVLEGARDTIERSHPAILFEVDEHELARGATPAVDALRELGYGIHGVRADGSLAPLERGEDPRQFREPWYALNLVALHHDSR